MVSKELFHNDFQKAKGCEFKKEDFDDLQYQQLLTVSIVTYRVKATIGTGHFGSVCSKCLRLTINSIHHFTRAVVVSVYEELDLNASG